MYDVVDDFVSRRSPYRAEHLLVLAGGLGDPADGALLVFRAQDGSVADAFVRRDPYVINGLVTRWEVKPWNVVIGKDVAGPLLEEGRS